MGVMLQAFYWDCPKEDNREFSWWNFVQERIPSLADAGFTSLWLPPVHKPPNIEGLSMATIPMIIMISENLIKKVMSKLGSVLNKNSLI